MATNRLSRFGTETSTTYTQDTGLRYTDAVWSGEFTRKNKGILPNTAADSVSLNTVLCQTSLVAYIIGKVLASGKIKTKNTSVDSDTTSIGVDFIESTETTQNVDEKIINPLVQFLDRINNIRNYDDGSSGESVWRSRQFGYDDTNTKYWKVNTEGTIEPSDANYGIKASFIHMAGQLGSTQIKLGLDGVTINDPVNIGNTLKVNSISCSDTISVSGKATLNGDVDIGSTSNNNINVWTSYNTSGAPSSATKQTLKSVLDNISWRLYNLGFRQGVASVVVGTTSENYIKRQGNYVIGKISGNLSRATGSSKENVQLFTIPEDFYPKQEFSGNFGISIIMSTGSGTASFTFSISTSGVGTIKKLSTTYSGTFTNYTITFGYEGNQL